jgi:hypothetical protein
MEPMRSVRSVSSLPLVSPHTRVLLVLDRQVDVSCLVRATTRHICAHSSIPSCLSILKPLCLVYIDDLFCPHGSRSKPAGRVGRYIYGALHALVGCWHAQCAKRECGQAYHAARPVCARVLVRGCRPIPRRARFNKRDMVGLLAMSTRA